MSWKPIGRWPQRSPATRFRFDPNGVLSTEQAIRFGAGDRGLAQRLSGRPGLRPERHAAHRANGRAFRWRPTRWWSNFEQLAANVLDTAVDVILLDTTFWGGIRPCVKAAGVCETFQLGVAVHSSGELGIQLATMLHLGAVLPNLTFAADAHYHHLTDDIIEGRQDALRERRDPRADRARAWACRLDRDKLRNTTNCISGWAAIPTTRTRCGQAGRR